jgi:hypothetical protein
MYIIYDNSCQLHFHTIKVLIIATFFTISHAHTAINKRNRNGFTIQYHTTALGLKEKMLEQLHNLVASASMAFFF